jgi:hypothetical protein
MDRFTNVKEVQYFYCDNLDSKLVSQVNIMKRRAPTFMIYLGESGWPDVLISLSKK